MIQVYIRFKTDKRDAWSSLRVVLTTRFDGGFVTMPERGRKTISAASEDTCIVHNQDCLSSLVQTAIYQLAVILADSHDVEIPIGEKTGKIS